MTPADPPNAPLADPALDLDGYLSAFEAAALAGGGVEPAAFLPPPDHPHYSEVLREILRVDLEFARSKGTPRRVEDYRDRFPALFRDPTALRELAWEEFRLRRADGESPDPREYRERLGVDLPVPAGWTAAQRLAAPPAAEWLRGRTPEVGDTIPPGYHLREELGRGAFGRVFLAHETGLGGRPVAVKFSARPGGEPLTLARLQHTNIVPVYAAHSVGDYTAVVMPFIGRTTLADLIASLRAGSTPRSGVGLASTLVDRGRSTAGTQGPSPVGTEPAPERPRAALDALSRMTFVEAVLWIGAELADGLAHAHDRGVLHRDVKPANVLLSDDGRPMLLDFNLAAAGARDVCGTPAYMAPEQLAAAAEDRGLATPRTDIYSLGLVLVELLAGRLPFDEPAGQWEAALPAMLAARRGDPLTGVAFPAGVTPGVRSILAKCLDPDPAARYGSAAELRDDLVRQRTHQPLRHAREASSREVVRKWARRHPRLSSGGTIAAAALVVVSLLTAGYLGRQYRLERLEAESARRELRDARDFTQAGLTFGPGTPAGEAKEILDRADAALGPYGVDSDDWVAGPLVARLSRDQALELRQDAAEVMFRAAGAVESLAIVNPSERSTHLNAATEWNRRALAAHPGPAPRTFSAQRARLLRAAGRSAEADEAERGVRPAPEPADRARLGIAALDSGNFAEAAEHLRAATRDESPRYGVWMGLAAAEGKLRRFGAAVDALSAAAALRPGSPWPYYHRGVMRLELGEHAAAARDFDRFLELRPNDPDGLLNRAMTRHGLGDDRGAVADLDAAERGGSTRTRLLALRSRVKRRLGDAAGADRDRAAFLARTPTDPLSWAARGEVKLTLSPPDARGAVEDFDRALALEPASLRALQGKASALSEHLKRPEDSLKVLDRIIELAPDSMADRAGRAVLLARLGRADDARRDIDACRRGAPSALMLYELASAALVLDDRPRGLELLRAALRKDPALGKLMPADPDLKSVWSDASFRALVEAAAVLGADR
jgi:serine/threonine protein kinase/tetratricopeptide (TPR) repeat protein